MNERRLRSDAQRNRESILGAAEIELRTLGVDASIDGIARRAGVGVGTVYRNYPTKEALLEAILANHVQPLLAAAHEARAAADAGAAFFAFVRHMTNASGDFKALADAMVEAGLDLNAAKQKVGGELFAAASELLARAQAAGAVRPDVTIEDVGTLMAGLNQAAVGGGDETRRSRCIELVCDALRGSQRVSPASTTPS